MNDQSDETNDFLEDVAKRLAEVKHAEKCIKACAGLPEGALDDGWTAAGISAYASTLEKIVKDMAARLATIAALLADSQTSIIENEFKYLVELANDCAHRAMLEHAAAIKASENPHA